MKKRNGFSLVDSLITLGLLAALMAVIVPLFGFAWLRTDASELAYGFINENQQKIEESLMSGAEGEEDFQISFTAVGGGELPNGFPSSVTGKKLTASSDATSLDLEFQQKIGLFTFVGIPATEEE